MKRTSVATLLVLLAAIIASCTGQNSTCLSDDGIQDIRLVDGTYGDFMGRVEIRFNGTWGTVCDDFWSTRDANVACRMLGYEGSVCSVSRARFGQGPQSSPIWLDNVGCRGDEECLEDCTFIGLDNPITSCSHREDAGVICIDDELAVQPPSDLTFHNSSTTSIFVNFSAVSQSALPDGADTIRYRISYKESANEDAFQGNTFFFPDPDAPAESIQMAIANLERDTEYSIQVGVDFRFGRNLCFSYVVGPLSNPILIRTNATTKSTNIPIRIVPTEGVNFTGRIEVLYNETWGTVCNDFFGTSDANLFCRAAGFERSLCTPRFTAVTVPGTGPIWLDDLNCPVTAEVIEDCSHPGFGVNNCDHDDDQHVVCYPGDNYLDVVSNVAATDVQANTATIQWEPVAFPELDATFLYQIFYQLQEEDTFRIVRSAFHPQTSLTLTRLTVGATYNVTVRAVARIRACFFSSVLGRESEPVNFTTIVMPPVGPPTNFHVIVLNSTAIEVQWGDPLLSLQNGEILGYTVFVQPDGGTERQFQFMTNSSDVARIIGGLTPSTRYSFSVLAFNRGGDGPRTIYLPARTLAEGTEPLITRFGVNGDGLDRVVAFTFQRNLNIHCGTSSGSNVQIDWFTENGTRIGITDRNLREAHYNNGTTILQIAASRRLNVCDGGVYVCVANDSGTVERKRFTLIINTSPARPGRPFPVTVKSNSIEIGWEAPLCDGGHRIFEYNLQFYESVFPTFTRVVQTIPHINVSQTTYVVEDLEPSTSYVFQVQSVTSDFRVGLLSPSRSITTLSPAPSQPRDVSVRIISAMVIEVSWRIPATPNGDIIQYTVYLAPLTLVEPTRRKRQAVEQPDIITVTFPGNVTSGLVMVPSTNVTYNVQVTASIKVGEDINEGERSELTEIKVPEPGIPTPLNFRHVMSTRSSVMLQWDLPPPPFISVNGFMVNYSATIDWKSPTGQSIQFTESGSIMVKPYEKRVHVVSLTPGTLYTFTIVANSERGPSKQAVVMATTLGGQADQGRVAYVQLRFGPVDKCSSFQGNGLAERLDLMQSALVSEIRLLCSCEVSMRSVQNGEFSCGDDLEEQVIYRARILGNDQYTGGQLVSLIQDWVKSDSAVIIVGSFRFKIDSDCATLIETLRSPFCPVSPEAEPEPVSFSTGEVLIFIVALVIVLILVAIIIVLSIMLIKKRKLTQNSGLQLPAMVRFKNGTDKEEDKSPFAEIGPSDQPSDFDSSLEKPSL